MSDIRDKEVSVAFQTDKPLRAYGALAAEVEGYGFDGVTVYNDMLYQPAWLPLLEIAHATQRVRIGPAAVNPFTCHPVNIAGNLALIDEAAEGRAYLGIARGAWLDYVGVAPERPVTALREALVAIRHFLQQNQEPLSGEIFPIGGGDAFRWQIRRGDVPFLLGSWGRQTIRVCAGLFNELKLGGTANPDVVPAFRDMLTRAGSQAAIAVGTVTVVDEDGQAARALARREVALYLPVVATLDPSILIEPELVARLQTAAARFDYDGVAALISDELLGKFAFAGTPVQVAEQAAMLFASGAGRIEFGTPHGLDPAMGLRLLGERVLSELAHNRM